MKLRDRVPKAGLLNREMPTGHTLEIITPLLPTLGVTRVADITDLDRIGIPVYNAIAPRSHDLLSVYNGKGRTHEDARASAIMEAVERFGAWQPRSPDRIAPYAELAAGDHPVLNPADHNLAPHPFFHADRAISWVTGFDLLAGEEVYVPLCLAGYYVGFHEVQCYLITTGNGLASGNSLEEAICHALCEVIERDAWTLADLVSNRLKQVVKEKLGAAPAGAEIWLEEHHPTIDPATLPEAARWFAERIQAAGIHLAVKDITSSVGVPSVAAMVAEDIAETLSPGHAGYGAHPNAEVAVIRALTEAAQSRAVDIQGMREDISLPGQDIESWERHVSRGVRTDRSVWPWRESGPAIDFADLPDHPSDDVRADIDLMLARLREVGLRRVIAVDRTPTGFPVHVARVIVPGLESWGQDQSRLGHRASTCWDATLKTLINMRDRVGR